jgi:hypothetical protein
MKREVYKLSQEIMEGVLLFFFFAKIDIFSRI